MRHGARRIQMSLITRLDGRSKDNNLLLLKDSQNNVLAEVKLLDSSGSTIEVTTKSGLHIEKPNGWTSKTN